MTILVAQPASHRELQADPPKPIFARNREFESSPSGEESDELPRGQERGSQRPSAAICRDKPRGNLDGYA